MIRSFFDHGHGHGAALVDRTNNNGNATPRNAEQQLSSTPGKIGRSDRVHRNSLSPQKTNKNSCVVQHFVPHNTEKTIKIIKLAPKMEKAASSSRIMTSTQRRPQYPAQSSFKKKRSSLPGHAESPRKSVNIKLDRNQFFATGNDLLEPPVVAPSPKEMLLTRSSSDTNVAAASLDPPASPAAIGMFFSSKISAPPQLANASGKDSRISWAAL